MQKSGGYEQTEKDFYNLNPDNVKELITKYGSGLYGTLSDGTIVVARRGSKSAGSTLEISPGSRKVYKRPRLTAPQ